VTRHRRTAQNLDPGCDHGAGCVTCGDEAIAMRVVRIDSRRGLALCDDGEGSRSSVEIGLVDAVAAGDTVLVHAGVALTRLDSWEAA
jgi:hydrogenase maturation factor